MLTKQTLRQLNHLLPRRPMPVTIRSGGAKGLRIVIDVRYEKFLWRGEHEPHLAQALAETLQLGDVFWDVGAHIGYFATQAARLVGSGGHVVAFEPMSETAARLARGVALNGFTNVVIVGEAIAAETGTRSLRSGRSSAAASLQRSTTHSDHQTVTVGTLDGYLSRHPIPNLVKVDVEGYETEVLRGGGELIAMRRTAFLVEFTNEELRQEALELLRGYDVAHVGDNHWLLTP